MKTRKPKALKIAAKPLTEDQIREFVEYYNEHKRFPGSKIPCNVTGKLTMCIGPWLVKKINEFGGPEQLLRGYKCRGANKPTKEKIKPVSRKGKKASMKSVEGEEIQPKVRTKRVLKPKKVKQVKEPKDNPRNWDIPKVKYDTGRPISDDEIAMTTATACLRPDVFLNNDRHCDGCEYFELCTSSLKNLMKKRHKR